tara:strand:+ start:756 stop:986 length:231 start_codon:yes stop_codon:yes gene_type:complete
MKKMLNGELVDMTAEEIAERETEVANEIVKAEEQLAIKETRETAQVNGNQKLLDLGLTQEEITALIGYTPPTEESE